MKEEKEEFEINRTIFGGYNRKQTLVYMNELQKAIEETQVAMEVMETENEGLKQNLAEAEKCYTALWEHSKELEEAVKEQEKAISQQREVIDSQKNDLISMKEKEKKQEQDLKRVLKKLAMNPVDDIERVIRTQLKKLHKKRRKKEKDN